MEKTNTSKSGLILNKESLSRWLTSTSSARQPKNEEKSLKQLELLRAYPDPMALLTEYSPDLQTSILASRCTMADLAKIESIPTLGLLNGTYGEETPIEWLRIQFGSLNDYAEQGKDISPEQMRELCYLVLSGYYYLNLAEICLFIARFKLGYYGEFYGAIGPMKISAALKQYVSERRSDLDIYERKNAIIERDRLIEERNKNSITHEEYLRRKELGIIGEIPCQNQK